MAPLLFLGLNLRQHGKLALPLILLLILCGAVLAGTYCVPREGDVRVSGVTGSLVYRPMALNPFVTGTQGYKVDLDDSYCTGGDPNTRTYVAIALGRGPHTGLTLPTEGSTNGAWYDLTVAANPNSAPFSGTSLGNAFDMAAQEYWLNVRVAYNSEDPNFAPWVRTHFWAELPASRPDEIAPAVDAGAGTVITPPTNEADAETFYASATGSAVADCVAAKDPNTPRTLQVALDCIDGRGDTVSAANGTYTSTAPYTLPNFSGDARWPIVVKAANRGSASLESTAGSIFSVAGTRAFWTFDGFDFYCNVCGATAFSVTSTGAGISFRYITDNALTQASQVVLSMTQGSPGAAGDQIIENWTLDRGYTGDVLDLTNYRGPVTFRSNVFDNAGASASHLLHGHNQGGGFIFEGNTVKNFTGLAEGALFLYLGSEESIIRDNIFYTLPIGITLERSGRVLVENNTFVNVDLGIDARTRSNMTTIRNNIFQDDNAPPGSSIGVRYSQAGGIGADATKAPEYGSTLAYNSFCGFSSANRTYSDATDGGSILTETGNCYGPGGACGAVGTPTNCNCGLTNPAGGDFSLDPNGPCDEAGDPVSPIPTGGSARRDMGAREIGGGAPPYAGYQTFWSVNDTTPKLNWTFNDPQNTLKTLWPLLMTDTDAQANYRIEVDASPLFNSVNDGNANGYGYPLLDSGTVASATAAHVIHASNALTGGSCYYARVRTTDDVLTARFGPWSDGTRKFCIQ